MSLTFGIPTMLAGMVAVAIPVLIHLLNRRRYQTVDWGAMQFLQISETSRRRLLLEEILLMLLRMGLIGMLVLALAAPSLEGPVLARFARQGSRDSVLILDGSYSMGYLGTGRTPHEKAKEWVAAYIDRLGPDDRVAILQAKQQVVPVIDALSQDLERARNAIARVLLPRGGCDWVQALQEADRILAKGESSSQEIIILSDGQRYGWADDSALARWELLAHLQRTQPRRARIWVVNLDPERRAESPNWSVAALRVSRAIASTGQLLTFRSALELRGQSEYHAPHRLRLEVDGKPVRDLDYPTSARLANGQVPISFQHRFSTPGSHLVSLIVEPDPPPSQRSAGHALKDLLPGDNRQDLAVEILPRLPVLIVDGDERQSVRHRGTDFLRDALAPARDPSPTVLARVVSVREFDPALLTSDLAAEPDTKPRVLVLSNVPRLLARQQESIASYLADGGGILVTLGERIDERFYNESLFRGGNGWLPARLQEVVGDLARPDAAPSPWPASLAHPALELFREGPAGGLADARFPRWHRLTTLGAAGVPIALLANQDPFLVEKSFQGGRVLLCAVPLDNSWRTNLPDLPAFAPLVHELIYYLAGVRGVESNFAPGQPLRFRPAIHETPESCVLQPPEGEALPLAAQNPQRLRSYPARLLHSSQGPLLAYEHTADAGVYQITTKAGRTVYYVAQADVRESDLTPCSQAERDKVSQRLPVTYENDLAQVRQAQPERAPRQELWWSLLLGVIALLCGEVWMTRRVTKGR
jgi:hypothetical protein